MKKLFLALTTLFLASCASMPMAQGEVLTVNKDRTIYVKGVISGMDLIEKADKIMKLGEKSKEPIYLVINSPGGAVLPGIQFISSMNVLQKRGIKFKCFVPMLAASMAFQIFAECDERYTFKNALHLWHPIRISGNFQALTPQTLMEIYKDLKAWEDVLVKSLKKKLNIDDDVFEYHYVKETLHLGSNLKEIAPDFLTIVTDVKGIPIRFSMREERRGPYLTFPRK